MSSQAGGEYLKKTLIIPELTGNQQSQIRNQINTYN